MNNQTFFIVLLACCSLVACGEVKFKDCGSVSGKINIIDIENCSGSSCILKKGTNTSITVVFTPINITPKVTAVVHGIIAGIPIPFPLPQSDGCKDSGLTCPLKGGVEVKYRTQIPVLKEYPSLKLQVKWELQDGDKKDLTCAYITAQIE